MSVTYTVTTTTGKPEITTSTIKSTITTTNEITMSETLTGQQSVSTEVKNEWTYGDMSNKTPKDLKISYPETQLSANIDFPQQIVSFVFTGGSGQQSNTIRLQTQYNFPPVKTSTSQMT